MSGYFMMRRADFMRVRESLDGRGFKILLEIAARLKPSKVSEVPYTFGTRVAGNSKLSGKVIYAYLVQLWKLSPMAKLMPAQFAKFAIVGSSGVLVNLGVMAAIISLTPYRDWHASTVATLVATVNNYVFNNFWTFRDRAHSGGKFVRRYVSYLIASLFGLAVTTSMFAVVSWALAQVLGRTGSTLQTPLLLLCQLLAILSGTLLNYELNKTMTWPKADRRPTVPKISSPMLENSAPRRRQ
jgi:dolichol-phosphate mannosyltransferase